MSLMSVAKATTVYIAYDRAGRVIYVGITGQGPGRNEQHRQGSEWWPYLDRQDVEHYQTRRVALAREAELIGQHRPPFNKQGNPGWESVRAAYLFLLSAESTFRRAVSMTEADRCIPFHGADLEEEKCRYGTQIDAGEPLFGAEGCGEADCFLCHARFHGVEQGVPIGYAARARETATARVRCGHCDACRSAEAVPAEFLTPEPCSAMPCGVCGSASCNYEAGKRMGERMGYIAANNELYENGEMQRIESDRRAQRPSEPEPEEDWHAYEAAKRATAEVAGGAGTGRFTDVFEALFNKGGNA